jgi:hypothetical protein
MESNKYAMNGTRESWTVWIEEAGNRDTKEATLDGV